MAEQKVEYQDKKTMMKEFANLGQKQAYSYQAKFFLNAFWKEFSNDAEKVWEFTHQFIELDKKGEKGSCLDEFQAHRLLEKQGTVLTVVEMRKALKDIDLDTDNKMSLVEYCVWRYKVDIETLMTRPQGVSKALEAIEEKIDTIQKDIAKVRKYKKKWDGKQPPAEGPKKIIYDQDMSILSNAEKALTENLDFAMKKLQAAQNNKDLVAPGKTWWLKREIEEAKKFAAPKKKVVH
mmetsp:Transcript_37023/g.59303  ORF Transcript_37023/g.59303 Transcript_37023/m.59303 type:complete len:235 (-) Transcript_37023:215-919(-)|eukprot:CAMPEP_0197020908 /NCGR_PEP_ID=MMETSP1384-20130603/1768_1 /TAXON_ID=29189 /ORGANISM="Ammonia sp." /LENGTH=234 /DNA_ID=CAMNT_0042448631 /DNA_START=68 /DNA_END=772 /DNA_ORIENTATION=+